MENYETLYRLSLIEGESRCDPQEFTRNGVKSVVREVLTENGIGDAVSSVVLAFTESVYYPYTSLKYQAFLVAALLDNYFHALGQHVPHDIYHHLHASHGVFVPGQFGTFPEEHSQSGIRSYLGSGLPDVESYDDLLLMRNLAHRWLLGSRPRDALNTHDIRPQSEHPALSHETIMRKPEGAHKQQTTKWLSTTHLHADDPDALPLGEDMLNGLQFGGKRNYGYGITRLKYTQVVDLDDLDYSRLEDGEAFPVEVTTPFALKSEYPKAADQDVPWRCAENRDNLRFREEKMLEQCEVFCLETVDHSQVLRYPGNCRWRLESTAPPEGSDLTPDTASENYG